jgi:hypothetical protein
MKELSSQVNKDVLAKLDAIKIQAERALAFPLMRLLDTIIDVWNINIPQPHVVVHEDNQSACQLVMNEAYKPRTRHLAVKYHHFCD